MTLGRWRCRLAAAALAAAALPSSGCSWLFVQRPPPGPLEPSPPVACTSSAAAPAADVTGAILLEAAGLTTTLVGILGAVCPPGESWCMFGYPSAGAKAAVTVVGLGLTGAAIAYAFSASYGFSHSAECRRLVEAQLACASGVEASCQSLQDRKP